MARPALLVSLLIALIMLGCTSREYTNYFKGFVVVQPEGWTPYEDDSKVVFVEPSGAGQLAVMVIYSQESISPARVIGNMHMRLAEHKTEISISDQSSKVSTLSGLEASESSALFTYSEGAARRRMYVHSAAAKSGDRYFVLSLTVDEEDVGQFNFQKYVSIFQDSSASFHIL